MLCCCECCAGANASTPSTGPESISCTDAAIAGGVIVASSGTQSGGGVYYDADDDLDKNKTYRTKKHKNVTSLVVAEPKSNNSKAGKSSCWSRSKKKKKKKGDGVNSQEVKLDEEKEDLSPEELERKAMMEGGDGVISVQPLPPATGGYGSENPTPITDEQQQQQQDQAVSPGQVYITTSASVAYTHDDNSTCAF